MSLRRADGYGRADVRLFANSVMSARGRLGRSPGAARLLAAWTLCYLILLQSIVGALAAGAMASPGGGGSILCSASGASPADGDTHGAVMRGLHCVLCPAAGSVPVLAGPPRLPLPVARIESACAPAPAGLAPGAAPICENARSRAPPPAA